jgi:hypothetical protein
MLISYSHKFIFIHIYKAAGTSIRSAITPFLLLPYQKITKRCLAEFGIQVYNTKPLSNHSKAVEIIELMGRKKFNKYFSFAVVRNPWDHQVSLYSYMFKKRDHPQHTMISAMSGFDEYIEWRCYNEVRLQSDFLIDSSGQNVVSNILKFENLSNDFNQLCKKINISAQLQTMNKSVRINDYKSYYNESTKKLVEKTFLQDIEFLKYKW